MVNQGQARNRAEPRLSRRGLLAMGLAGLAAPALHRPGVAAEVAKASHPEAWRTWLLTSGDELRPPSPSPPTAAEIEELVELQASRTVETGAKVTQWGSGPAVLPWTAILLDLIRRHQPSPVRAGQALALLHVALLDTVVAIWDARAAHPRPAPPVADRTIVPLGDVDPAGSFPSEHAAIAAAAEAVIVHLFPKESADGLARLAEEAAESRLWGGLSYRSDVETGLAIGRAVGARAVARAGTDGSTASHGTIDRPDGAGSWQPTPPGFLQQPLDPQAGGWLTWVLGDVAQYRPAPPPAYRSPGWVAELAAVQEAVARRTPEQEGAVRFWAGGPGTVTPGGLWVEIARDLALRHALDLPHTARILALTSVAVADAFICCWDAKYTYWTARPITADPSLDVLIPTPPFPSYTSGHATISAAASTVLAHLFPEDEVALAARAEEARNSRLWAGIHFPIDNDMGAVAGRMVGRLVAERARTDGAG